MNVTYLGNKKDMVAFGVDFSKKKTHDLPEDHPAIDKFKGNRFFHCDGPGNIKAPKFYVHPIKKLPSMKKIIRVKENTKLKGFDSEEDAEKWINTHGKLGVTHYVKESDEDIMKTDGLVSKKQTVKAAGVFKLKNDGAAYKKPEKVFEGENCHEDAKAYFAENELNGKEFIIQVA